MSAIFMACLVTTLGGAAVMATAAPPASAATTVAIGIDAPHTSDFPNLGAVSVTISPVPDGGSVQLLVDGSLRGSPVDVNTVTGKATLAALPMSVADTYSVAIRYVGDANFASQDTAPVSWVVNPAPTDTSVSVDPPTSYAGDFVNLYTDVSPKPDEGDVTITLDGVDQPSQSVNTTTGFNTFGPFTSLAAGQHTVHASYSGSINYAASATTPDLTFTVAAKGKPGAPTAVTAVRGNGQAIVSWTAPALDGGYAISGSVITPYLGATALPGTTYSDAFTSHAVVGLANGVAYTFKVAVKNSAGTGPQSAASAPVTPASAPGVPTGVSGSGSATGVTVSWTAPTADGGSPLTGYWITPYLAGVAQPIIVVPTPVTTRLVTGLTTGNAYTFKVAAVNSVGTGAKSAASSIVVPPFASTVAFVQQQMHDVLGRSASGSEEVNEAAALASGNSPAAFVGSLRRSPDAVNNVDPATRLYFAYFLRIPDRGGLNYWIAQKRGGKSLYSISDFFAASSEFKATYGNLNNADFVNLIYMNVLGRPGDPVGLDYWTNQLDTHAKTRGQVMVGYSESSEYKAKKAPSVDVAVTWIDLLAAAPDQASFNQWVADLTSGPKTVTSLAGALLADSRYSARFV